MCSAVFRHLLERALIVVCDCVLYDAFTERRLSP